MPVPITKLLETALRVCAEESLGWNTSMDARTEFIRRRQIISAFERDCMSAQNPALELANALVMGLQHGNWPWGSK